MNEIKKPNRIKLTDKKKNQMRVVLHQEAMVHKRKRKQRERDYWNSFK
jgi:hypothetical protein